MKQHIKYAYICACTWHIHNIELAQKFVWVFLHNIMQYPNELFQFSSVSQSCPILCHPVDCSTPGFPVYHQLLELVQTHVHRVCDAIQPSHPLSSPSLPAFNLSQHQGLFQRVNTSHEVAKVLEFQLQHQSFQWTPRTGLVANYYWTPTQLLPSTVEKS